MADAFEQGVAAGGLPGAVGLIADSSGTRYLNAAGMADATTGVPMREDTLFQIASMTKAITSAAAMQLVERGKLSLDDPIGQVLPELAEAQVLEGFDGDGAPILRPAARPITLRHLLNHTSGLGYSFIDENLLRYLAHTGMQGFGRRENMNIPLLFDPGDKWLYGFGSDWAGLAVEAASGMKLGDWFASELTGPLGMKDTRFRSAEEIAGAAKIHARGEGGAWSLVPMSMGEGEFQSGGGGLSATAEDYARFMRMILRDGELDGVRVLKAETVQQMKRNNVGPIDAGIIRSAMPEMLANYDPMPGQQGGWTVGGFYVNPDEGPAGRSPGSLHWAGVFNSYYWIDPARDLAGLVMAQMTPFADPGVLSAFAALEQMAYS